MFAGALNVRAGGEVERAAHRWHAFHPDPPAHRFNETLRYLKSQSASLLPTGHRRGGPSEAGKDSLLVFGRYSGSRVRNAKPQRAGLVRIGVSFNSHQNL